MRVSTMIRISPGADADGGLMDRITDFARQVEGAGVTYEELAERLKEHGLSETRDSIAAKLKRGTFAATFFLAVMAAIGRENVNLSDL
jgi:hypothetical protein